MKLKSLSWRPTGAEVAWWLLTAVASAATVNLLQHGSYGRALTTVAVAVLGWKRFYAATLAVRCNCTHPFGDHSEHRCHTEGCDCRRFSR